MDLIERYLVIEAAGAGANGSDGRCPQRSGDVSAKLRTVLLARIEAREAALRRPLRDDEAVVEFTAFARRLLVESRAVMRRLDEARLSLEAASAEIPEGESCGPH